MSKQTMTKIYYRKFIIYTALLITISLCGLFCLSGCKDKTTVIPVAPSITKKSTAINSKKVKGFQARLDHLMEPVTYHYNSEGKPDPFQPFLKTAQKVSRRATKKLRRKKEVRRPEICATPLECMDVGQLTLVGIIANDKGNRIAMAQDAAGIGYFLKPGLRVGYRNGRVKKILPDRVIVEEELENIRGELTSQERVLLLHPEGK
ncbi:MAG: pilus assembly protein PilP [Thermodesulfobacteriota bacterium]|nr:pilus assembly protein PilP [Thermodesulfobacteriota bacterium]